VPRNSRRSGQVHFDGHRRGDGDGAGAGSLARWPESLTGALAYVAGNPVGQVRCWRSDSDSPRTAQSQPLSEAN